MHLIILMDKDLVRKNGIAQEIINKQRLLTDIRYPF